MAFSFNGTADLGSNGGSSGNLTVAYTVNAASNLLVVMAEGTWGTTGDNISGVTYNGLALTKAVGLLANGGNTRSLSLWYLINPPTGSHNVVVGNNGNAFGGDTYIIAGAADYTIGVAPTFDNSVTNSVSGNPSSISVTFNVTHPNEAVVAAAPVNGSHGTVTTSGLTVRSQDGSFNTWVLADTGAYVAQGNNTLSFSFSTAITGTANMVAAAFYDAGITVTADARPPIEGLASPRQDVLSLLEYRGGVVHATKRGIAGAYGRAAFGRGAYTRGPLIKIPVNARDGAAAYGRAGYGRSTYARSTLSRRTLTGGTVQADAILRAELLSGVLRFAGNGLYPAPNTGSSLASGMAVAYFPGYYNLFGNVPDATGHWLPMSTHGVAGQAGSLINMPGFGPAMQFDGIYDGLWAIGAGNPLSGLSQYTIAIVCNVLGPCHQYGAGFCLSLSTDPSQNQRQHVGLYTVGLPAGQGQFTGNGAQAAPTAPAQNLPTGLSVVILTVNLTGGTTAIYVNGAQTSGTTAASALVYDTLALGCRAQNFLSSPFTLSNGSTTMTGTGNEDIVIGALVADTAAAVAANTVCTNYDLSSTYTLSQAAVANASSDTITFGPPITKLAHMQLGLAAGWNRLLTPGEIASFSSNPLGAFITPAGYGGVQIEDLAGLLSDVRLLAEWLARQQRDDTAVLDWRGTAGTTATRDSFLAMENIGSARGDAASVPTESSGTARGDAPSVPTESPGTARRDD